MSQQIKPNYSGGYVDILINLFDCKREREVGILEELLHAIPDIRFLVFVSACIFSQQLSKTYKMKMGLILISFF